MNSSGSGGLSIIVAAAANNVIGIDNRLPWHLPDDLRRFRRITMGRPVLMGRRTHESIGKPLPGRRNIVLSRDPHYRPSGCETATTLDAAITLTEGDAEPMVIGGAGLYREALPLADRIYLTRLHSAFEGDTFFPDLDGRVWHAIEREDHPSGPGRDIGFSFLILERREVQDAT